MLKNGWVRKIWLHWKCMTSQPEKQIIAVRIWTSHSQKWWRNFLDPFLKNQNWEYLGSIGSILSSFIRFVFIVLQVEDYQNILKLSCRPLTYTSYKAFLKSKKSSRTSLPATFSAWFLNKKYFSCYILLPDQISLSNCLYLVRYWVICVL